MSGSPRFPAVTRSDYVFVRILLVVAVLTLIITSLSRLWPSGPVQFTGALREAGPEYAAPDLRPGVTATYAPEITWTLQDPTFAQRLLAGLPMLVLLVCGLGIAWALWQLLNAADRGEPFTHATVRSSRWLAALVLAAALLYPTSLIVTHFALVTQIRENPEVLMVFSGADFLPIVAGMLLVALTEVYARGLALRDDVEGLV